MKVYLFNKAIVCHPSEVELVTVKCNIVQYIQQENFLFFCNVK